LKNGPWNTKKHSGSSFSNAQSRELAQLGEIVLKQEMVIRDCKQSVFSKKQVVFLKYLNFSRKNNNHFLSALEM